MFVQYRARSNKYGMQKAMNLSMCGATYGMQNSMASATLFSATLSFSYSYSQLLLLLATLIPATLSLSYSYSQLLLLSATLISATLILSYSVSASLIFSYSTHSYSISAILLSAILLSGGTRICISEVFQLNFLR